MFTIEVILARHRIPVELRRLIVHWWFIPTVEDKMILYPTMFSQRTDIAQVRNSINGLFYILNKARREEDDRCKLLFPSNAVHESYLPKLYTRDELYINYIGCHRIKISQSSWQASKWWQSFRSVYKTITDREDDISTSYVYKIVIDVDQGDF